MVPTEAMKVKRFKAGLVTPLYNALVAIEFLMLSKLVDMQSSWRRGTEKIRKKGNRRDS